MGKFWIGAPDWSDPGTFTASSERTSFPVTHLQKEHPGDRWEFDSATGSQYLQVIRSDLSSLYAIGLMETNATEGAGWRIRLADTEGNLTASPSVDTAPLGTCLELDGTDSASATEATYTTTTFTMEVWVKSANPGFATIMTRTGGSIEAALRITSNGKAEFVGLPGLVGQCIGTTTLEADTWYHLAGAYDAGTDVAKLFVNGVEEDSATSVTSHADGTMIVLGPLGGAQPARHRVNHPRLWDKFRTGSEILADASLDLNDPTTNLIGLWKLDEATGTTAANEVSGKASMTLSPAPAWTWPSRLWGSPDEDETDDRRNALHVESIGGTYGALRIDILDTENPDAVFRAGRLFVGSGVPFVQGNIVYGSGFSGVEDRSRLGVTARGLRIVNRGRIARTLPVQFAHKDVFQAQQLQRIWATRGGSRDVMAVYDHEGPTRAQKGHILGLMGLRMRQTQDGYNFFRGSLEVTER
jgi:hypothetical protein